MLPTNNEFSDVSSSVSSYLNIVNLKDKYKIFGMHPKQFKEYNQTQVKQLANSYVGDSKGKADSN